MANNESSFQNFDGDDFSNNLIQDLGPLLSLFGADVTTQFLSQSISWADNILFAIGPLGVVTAVISAIRVGAPQSLRSFIGKAREPRAEVEMELLSSTSREVCEMWNGTSLLRVRGESNVVELLVAFNKDGTRPSLSNGLGLHVKEEDSNPIIETGERTNAEKTPAQGETSADDGGDDIESSGSKVPQPLQPSSQKAPNISLNCLPSPGNTELFTLSALSLILQGVFLALDGWMVDRWKWSKNGAPMAGTAFPFVAAGTLILTAGMGACSAVIQWSTRETWYHIKRGTDARIIWIQKKSVVDDQHFGSYAIFAPKSRKAIVSSSRENHFQADDPASLDEGFTLRMLAFKTVTVCAVALSAVGYVIQFIGFRQMHWLATIFQLALSIIMTAIRAYVRRSLSMQPLYQALPSGHEMDWLATRTALYKQLPPDSENGSFLETQIVDEKLESTNISPPTQNGKKRGKRRSWSPGDLILWVKKRPKQPWYGTSRDRIDWLVAVPPEDVPTTGKLPLNEMPDKGLQPEETQDHELDSQTILRVRSRLQDLARWDVGEDSEWASFQSIVSSLTAAIGGVMNSLSDPELFSLNTSSPRLFEWIIHVGRAKQTVKFQVKKDMGQWTAIRSELEAALSLWVYSLKSGGRYRDYAQNEKAQIETIALAGKALVRDSIWWIPGAPWNIRDEIESTLKYSFLTKTASPEDLTTRLCAWQLFAQFMRCATTSIRSVPGPSTATVRHERATTVRTPTSRMEYSVELRHRSLQHLVNVVQSSGLCSEVQAYLAIIPPLSKSGKLPHPSSLVDSILDLAQSLEKHENWLEAADLYVSLIDKCETFEPTSEVLLKSIAVSAEYLSILSCVVDVYDIRSDEVQAQHVRDSAQRIGETISSCDPEAVVKIREYYELQGQIRDIETLAIPLVTAGNRRRDSSLINSYDLGKYYPNQLFTAIIQGNSKEALGVIERNRDEARRMLNEQDIFGWTPLHYFISSYQGSGEDESEKYGLGRALLLAGGDPNVRSVLGRSPLHCAVLSQSVGSINLLVQFGADMNARDAMGKTPMHIAARIMDKSLVSALYDKGADIDARDHFGQTPIHDAALMGNLHNVEFLAHAQANIRAREGAGMTPVHFLCGQTRCDIPQVSDVLRQLYQNTVASSSERDQEGRTPLHHAFKSGCLSAINFFCSDKERGHLQMDDDQAGMTPLHWAAKNDQVKALIKVAETFGWSSQTPLISSRDRLGRGLLHIAVLHRGIQVVNFLLKENWSSVGELDDEKMTPLHLCQDETVARILIAFGADKNARDKHRRKPIHYARDLSLISVLLKEHRKEAREAKKVSYWQDVHRQTPLHFSVASGYCPEAIGALVEGLPRLQDAQDKDMKTALHHLVDRKDTASMADIIPKLKTDTSQNARDKDGKTALGYAISRRNKAAVKLFLNHGIQPHVAESLRAVAVAGDLEIASLILDKLDAGDVNIKFEKDGMTPLHVAVEEGNMDLADFLVERGANYCEEDNEGRVPADLIHTQETREATRKTWESMRKMS